MHKIIASFILATSTLFLSENLYAQKDITKFLGIPVDGDKTEMIKKLKNKGYTINPQKKDILKGQFNGYDVNIHIATNNNNVCRIMVVDVNNISEGEIKIRFNKLCEQFLNNKKYISLLSSNYKISDDEDISYQMTVNKKRYEAVFYQLPDIVDSAATEKEIETLLLKKYTKEQLTNPTEETRNEIINTALSFMLDKYSKKPVWFMINEIYGEYYISMFYDNEYNRANGDDL